MGGSEVGGPLGTDLLVIVGDAAAAFGEPTRDEDPFGCSLGDALGLLRPLELARFADDFCISLS